MAHRQYSQEQFEVINYKYRLICHSSSITGSRLLLLPGGDDLTLVPHNLTPYRSSLMHLNTCNVSRDCIYALQPLN